MSKEIARKQKEIFSKKLNYYMKENGVSQSDIVNRFGITASTVSDWCNAKKYPRIDKIQMLADFFGILKSDLTEEKPLSDDELLGLLKNNSNHATIIGFGDGRHIKTDMTYEDFEEIEAMWRALKEKRKK